MTVCLLYNEGFISRAKWGTVEEGIEDIKRIIAFSKEYKTQIINIWIEF